MKDRPIQVGDLVQVVQVCCSNNVKYLGRVGIVVESDFSNYFRKGCGCKSSGLEFRVPDAGSDQKRTDRGWFMQQELRRIPPLDELEGERTEEKLKETS